MNPGVQAYSFPNADFGQPSINALITQGVFSYGLEIARRNRQGETLWGRSFACLPGLREAREILERELRSKMFNANLPKNLSPNWSLKFLSNSRGIKEAAAQ